MREAQFAKAPEVKAFKPKRKPKKPKETRNGPAL
jgi:hypothetical protein